ncbi:hypothetical protein JRO89_XS06G0222300 [Xanthoceras sorbifolium]|uniref:Uncharacterized protein n=1 Tax=Xanthoceras sorbifolium TaxID=99658 RepID=A0ABQ8HZ36_9ROSI|nr:hypothetical protein JRO89_XS06G0222300 [Xanthoceras sorbifolium]
MIAIERAKSLGKEVTAEVIPWKQDLELNWEHWCNTTGLLKIDLDLKKAFLELVSMDPDFKSSNLTKEQWDQARVFHECSDYLADTVFLNHWTTYQTANRYFPVICSLYMKSLMFKKQEVLLCCLLGFKSKTDKYWCFYKLVLVVVVLSAVMKEKTGLVVKIALDLKEAFLDLVSMDPDFKYSNLTKEQWDQARVIDECSDYLIDTVFLNHWTTYQTANRAKSWGKEVTAKVIPWKQDLELKWEHRCNTTGLLKIALDLKEAFLETYQTANSCCSVISCNESENWFSSQGLLVDPIDYICDICDEVLNIIKGCLYKCMSEILNYIREASSKNRNFQIAIERAKSSGKEVIAEVIPSNQYLELKWEYWCNTAGLFKIALDLKVAFFELESVDPDFKSKYLTKEQWDQARVIDECYEDLTDTAFFNHWRHYQTANMYFSIICSLFTKSLMLKKHEVWLCYWFWFKSEADKYWCVYKLVLAVVVLSVVMKEKTDLVLSILMKEKIGLAVKVYAFIPLIIFVTSVMKF